MKKNKSHHFNINLHLIIKNIDVNVIYIKYISIFIDLKLINIIKHRYINIYTTKTDVLIKKKKIILT